MENQEIGKLTITATDDEEGPNCHPNKFEAIIIKKRGELYYERI